MASEKVKYIPRHKRQQKKATRLHGAFSGGFSAGYFNTVGSREGWQPSASNEEERRRRPQQLEDFMDEHDHNEWGGPKLVRSDVAGGSDQKNRKIGTDEISIVACGRQSENLLSAAIGDSNNDVIRPPESLGKKLLQNFGWRGEGSSTALVSRDTSKEAAHSSNEMQKFLSARRLQRIQVQQERITIPLPKSDKVGLGFEAHENAPEFRAYHEKKRQRIAERAKGTSRPIYRLSNVLGKSDKEADQKQKSSAVERSGFSDFETSEDFAGTRSASGFALHDDYDDAFDDEVPLSRVTDKVRLDKDMYDTVVQDPYNSEEEENTTEERTKDTGLGNFSFSGTALSDWMKMGTGDDSSKASALGANIKLSDGRLPLPGFVVGDLSDAKSNVKFRGPDVPRNYRIQPHGFAPDDHPLVWQTLAHASQLEVDEVARQHAAEQVRESRRKELDVSKQLLSSTKPMAGIGFSDVASSMKMRFTMASSKDSHATIPKQESLEAPTNQNLAPKPIIRRTSTFVPVPLLCKRFGVAAPKAETRELLDKRGREEMFFEDQVLKSAAEKSKIATASGQQEDENDEKETAEAKRPAMSIYKSIFGINADELDSEPEEEPISEQPCDVATNLDTEGAINMEQYKHTNNNTSNLPRKGESVDQTEKDADERHESKKHRRRTRDDDDSFFAVDSFDQDASPRNRHSRKRSYRSSRHNDDRRSSRAARHDDDSDGADNSKRERHRRRHKSHKSKRRGNSSRNRRRDDED